MKKIIIDTNIYSNAMRGVNSAVSILQRYEQIAMSPVVIGELFSGFKKGKLEAKNKLQLKEFLLRERVIMFSITNETSEFYALILNQLREQGTPIPTNDIWIAASAMENGAAIASEDKHFSKIKGIILVQPE